MSLLKKYPKTQYIMSVNTKRLLNSASRLIAFTLYLLIFTQSLSIRRIGIDEPNNNEFNNRQPKPDKTKTILT